MVSLVFADCVNIVCSKNAGVKGLSNELMQLRKICQHPFLFESVEDKINPGGMIDEKLIRSSGKIELLARILPKFFSTGHRVSRTCCISMGMWLTPCTGPHFLPDDESHGHHGRLLEDDGLAILASGWWDEDGRTCYAR